jgi:hypothetical protein
MPSSALSVAASPVGRRRRLRVWMKTFSAPEALARALRARFPKSKTTKESVDVGTPVKRSRTRLSKSSQREGRVTKRR